MREGLQDGHVLIWMDFAENFTCTALEEVQSAYWTADMVTLHTSVVYFPSSHTKTHMSIVGISETLSHNATTVFAMLKELLPIVQTEYQNISTVHYLTDSPTSQYRNKTIFNILCQHEILFGSKASWDFLEAGHGKGPCDGLDASVKRSADSARKQGKASIQSASDFYQWASETSSASVVRYYYVSQEEYLNCEKQITEMSKGLKSVPGTMLVHSIIPVSETEVAVRNVSCHCKNCDSNVKASECRGWSYHLLKLETGDQNENEETNELGPNTEIQSQDIELVKPTVGQYVIAYYQGNKYVGLVQEVDETEQDEYPLYIHFMKQSSKKGNSYFWPAVTDDVWRKYSHIVCVIEEPRPEGRSQRFFNLAKDAATLMEIN